MSSSEPGAAAEDPGVPAALAAGPRRSAPGVIIVTPAVPRREGASFVFSLEGPMDNRPDPALPTLVGAR